jgi:hypothetical protein
VLDAAARVSLFIIFLYVFWPSKGSSVGFSVVLVFAAAARSCLVLYFSYLIVIKYCVFVYILTVTVAVDHLHCSLFPTTIPWGACNSTREPTTLYRLPQLVNEILVLSKDGGSAVQPYKL